MTQLDSKRTSEYSRSLPSPSTSSSPPSMTRSPLANAVSGYTSPRLFSRRESEDARDQKYPRDVKERKPDYKIISFRDTSQYSKGGISSCGLAAVNSASRILPMVSVSSEDDVIECLEREETATSIMSICSFWDSDEHLEVQDILGLPLFSCHLETIEVQDDQCTPSNFRKITQTLVSNGPSAAIITRAPEIVALMNIPPARSRYESGWSTRPAGNKMVIFDSHPRPEHPLGAAFLVFPNPNEAATYLSKLFEVDAALLADPNNWQTQMLTRYSAHILKARQSTEQEELDALYSANVKLLGVNVQMKEALIRESDVQSELAALRERLEAMKERRKQASKEETDAEKRLRALKRELEDAKELVKSFPGVQIPDFKPPSESGSRARQPFEDSNKREFKPEVVNPDPKGKGRDVAHSFHGSVVDDEAAEYERVRIERLERLGISSQNRFKPKDASLPDAPVRTSQDLPPRQSLDNRELATRMLETERDDFERARQLQMEEDRKALEHARAMQGSDEGFKCEICMEFWSLGMVAHVDDCEHTICRDCMKGNIKAELDLKRWPIMCPMCRAENRSEPGIIYRHVAELAGADDEMIARWNEVELAVVSVLITCPTCKKTANIDVKDFEEASMLHCPHNCGAYWCKKCSQIAERGKRHTCNGDAEFERWREDNPDVRLCPGCKMPIQRTEGCRHMICIRPGCNTHFCDQCGGKLIQSQNKKEIDAAVEKHFSGECKLFEYEIKD